MENFGLNHIFGVKKFMDLKILKELSIIIIGICGYKTSNLKNKIPSFLETEFLTLKPRSYSVVVITQDFES